MLSISLLHLLTNETESMGQIYCPRDAPPDQERFPELWGAQVSTGFCYGAGVELMRSRPTTFAMACLVEVQARWQSRGVDVSGATCPCRPPPDVAERLSERERANYRERLADTWMEYLPRLTCLVEELPQLEYLKPIAAALAAAMKPSVSKELALLSGPIHSCIACALPGCNAMARADGRPLQICSGGCGGLARYCCAEHQKAHWKQHKAFCQRVPKRKGAKEAMKELTAAELAALLKAVDLE